MIKTRLLAAGWVILKEKDVRFYLDTVYSRKRQQNVTGSGVFGGVEEQLERSRRQTVLRRRARSDVVEDGAGQQRVELSGGDDGPARRVTTEQRRAGGVELARVDLRDVAGDVSLVGDVELGDERTRRAHRQPRPRTVATTCTAPHTNHRRTGHQRRNRIQAGLTGNETHTNGPFSGTSRASRYQKGKTNLNFTEAGDSELQVAVASAGLYASLHLDPDR